MLSNVIGAEFREVADREVDGQAAKAVIASRTYDTDIADLWDALTNAERIPRWFSPVSGELKLGGRYQIQGNAGGLIKRCEPPRALDITWEFGGGMSWVALRLVPHGGGARLTLEHLVLAKDVTEEHWRQFGPGAVGVGWDLSFLGLGLHLASGGEAFGEHDPAWMATDEAKAFMRTSAEGWAEAHIASGEDADIARGMAARTAAFYTGG